jgi:peptidoglycan/LPS O-acetylase OafA/YrhL
MSERRITALDGIRGVAILLVLAGHITQNLSGIEPRVRLWLMAFANSSAGVRLFFVLSGYLITTLLAQEYQRSGTVSLRQFYWHRALRIFPAFYVYFITLAVIEWFRGGKFQFPAFLAAGTFTWNYAAHALSADQSTYWNLGHLWTLALEQQFYLFWPLVLLALRPPRTLIFSGILLLWCPLARIATYILFPEQRGYVGMMFHTGIDSIMAGCAAALVVRSAGSRDWIARRARLLFWGAAVWLLVCSPILATIVRGSPIAIGFSIDAIAAACVIAVLHHSHAAPLRSWFEYGFLPSLGIISYSLYLWQQLFLGPDNLTQPINAVFGIVAATAIAFFSYTFVEKPALRWKNSRRPAPKTVSAALPAK